MGLVVRIPLRASFGGGGSDVREFYEQYGGAVLVSNIAKYVYIHLEERKDQLVFLQDIDFDASIVYHYDKEPDPNEFLNLAKACVKYLDIKTGVTITIKSDVAPGSGLGTSSAITVGILYGLMHLCAGPVFKTAGELAAIAYHVERDILGMAGGTQDQFSAAYAGVNFFEFTKGQVKVQHLDNHVDFKRRLESLAFLCYSGQTHLSSDIMESQKAESKVHDLLKIKDSAYQLLVAWKENKLREFVDIVNQSYLVKKNTHSKVTNNHLDKMYDAVLQYGGWGGKLLGAGGGGYFLFFAPFQTQQKVKSKLRELGGTIEPFLFDHEGILMWNT